MAFKKQFVWKKHEILFLIKTKVITSYVQDSFLFLKDCQATSILD